jgi:hypothetical protein
MDATKFYRTVPVSFVLSFELEKSELVTTYFKATTEDAAKLARILETRFTPKEFEFIGEGEFLGWSIKEIEDTWESRTKARLLLRKEVSHG